MDDKKVTNGAKDSKRPSPPPIVPKRESDVNKGKNKKLLICK